MRRVFGFLSLLFAVLLINSLCACCGSTPQPKPLSPVDIASSIDNATVALTRVDEDGDTIPFCTGVWVSQTVILTAGHCLVGLANLLSEERNGALPGMPGIPEELEKLLQSNLLPPVDPTSLKIQYIIQSEETGLYHTPTNKHDSSVIALYKKKDLALLKAEGPIPQHAVAHLAGKTPRQAERLHFVGHVNGLYWTYVQGVVSAYRKDFDKIHVEFDGPFLQVSAPVYTGNSGGGAFNDQGELVGIASFILPAPNVACYIHLETIRSVLQGQKIIPVKLDPNAPDPNLE